MSLAENYEPFIDYYIVFTLVIFLYWSIRITIRKD